MGGISLRQPPLSANLFAKPLTHPSVRGTKFVGSGAVTPGSSCECDITSFVSGRPNSAQHLRDNTVAVRRVQSVTVPVMLGERQMSFPRLKVPSLKKCPKRLG